MNEERKNDFENFTPINQRLNKKALFSRIGDLENKYNKDLCEFNSNQLIELFNMEEVQTQLAHMRVYVSNYLDFCYLKEYTKTTNVIKKENLTLTKLIEINPHLLNERVLYLSPKKYQDYLNLIGEDINADYFKAIVMAIYEGVLGKFFENLVFLSIKDIDRENRTIRLHTGKKIQVSKELVKQLILAYNVDYVVRGSKKMILEDVLDNDAVFKTYSKAKNDEGKLLSSARRKFYTYISECITKIVDDDKLNANMIYTSGLVNYVLQRLEENNQSLTDDKKAVEDYLKEFGVETSYKHFRTYYYKYINSYYDKK